MQSRWSTTGIVPVGRWFFIEITVGASESAKYGHAEKEVCNGVG